MAGTRRGSIHLWSSPSLGPLAGPWSPSTVVSQAHDGGEFNAGVVNAVNLFEDKVRAVSGGLDWSVKLWDITGAGGLENGRKLGDAGNCHSAAIRDISMCDRNNIFATCGDDGCVLAWDGRAGSKGSAIAKLNVSDRPCTGCMFEPHGINGGGNWIITSDREGRIKLYDLRKWELARVIYDSEKAHRGGTTAKWEGGGKTDLFVDVQISTEGWVCAVTEPGVLYSWMPEREWEMAKQPTNVKATCLSVARIMV